MAEPRLLVADTDKKIYDLPGFVACGQAGSTTHILLPEDLIPLPQGSNLYLLPDRVPVGFNIDNHSLEMVEGYAAVAAFLPPGYTQLYTAAYVEGPHAGILPLFAYTPVALCKGKFFVPAIHIDKRKNHDITSVDRSAIDNRIKALQPSKNRLIPHLATCARCHGCPNAINFFLGKLECPLPVSPGCNARCLGCISLQKKGTCPSTQTRIRFKPAPEEIAEIALMHIARASNPMVSFGQGCEGEPLLEADRIIKAIRLIRHKTSYGTIHMNTNGSLPQKLDALFIAGLDSIRVSLNSAQERIYRRYYSPQGYGFSDLKRSIMVAKKHGRFVALNYLVMPGLTDTEDEYKAMVKLIADTSPDMIQWRNLNYDPQRYSQKIAPRSKARSLGMRWVMDGLKKKFPQLLYGYFNVPVDRR